MSLSDTAEYWWDVKRPYMGPEYYHIPGFECGRKHWNEAKYIHQVNCTECKEAIKSGYNHNLKTKEQYEADIAKQELERRDKAIKKWIRAHPSNPMCPCGFIFVKRSNRSTREQFWGCCQYPRCKNTKQIINNQNQKQHV